MNIYVASSWRNAHQPSVVAALRTLGHAVYDDFRHPSEGGPVDRMAGLLDDGFRWSDIDPHWQTWDPENFRRLLIGHALAHDGFNQDMAALKWCDTCVLVLPSGRSAHLEAGWAAGAARRLIILLLGELEPELMYLIGSEIVLSIEELTATLPLEGA